MTIRKAIEAAGLAGLDVQEGDVLRVVSVTPEHLLLELQRDEPTAAPDPTRAAEWVASARGIVPALDDSTAADPRMDYYRSKYRLDA